MTKSAFGLARQFLNGPFARWNEESEAYLEVVGQIRADVAGALFRVPPTRASSRAIPIATTGGRATAWCGVYLRDGEAAYRTRWVETDSDRFG